MRTWRSLSSLVCALLPGTGCSDDVTPAATADPPPNLVVISIDTLRADHLSCYGYDRSTSPNLDAFAAEGVRFSRAFSPTAWTLQGHASLFTGIRPSHSVVRGETTRVADDVPLLAEILQQQGYRTGAVVNGVYLKGKFGFDRGFDRYEFIEKGRRHWQRHEQATHDLMDSVQGERPYFLFFHFMSVHTPYDPPADCRGFLRPYSGELTRKNNRDQMLEIYEGERRINRADRNFLIDLYDGGILATDRRVGRLLQDLDDRLGVDDTLVLVTSDHGEEFLEHGGVLHTRTLFDEILAVPLMMRGPGVPAGVTLDSMVSLTDVLPTTVELLGLRRPATLDGVSLVPLLSGAEDEAAPWIELATFMPSHGASKWGVRTRTGKFIIDYQSGERSYFDLVADPEEEHNLYPCPQALQLEEMLARRPPPRYGSALSGTDAVDAEDLEQLRELGYVR